MPASRPALNFLSIYGLVGFSLAVAVHLSTFTDAGLSPDQPLFWLLHIGIFPLFFPMVIRLRAWSESTTGAFGMRRSQLRWRELLGHLPPAAIAVGALLFAYAMINFLLSTGHLPERGAHVAATSAAAALEEGRYTVRGFSGHWMVFYAMPTLFFLYVPKDAAPREVAS